ncbi:hypothetical protein [Cytophaga hutchinsonii]|uniref:Uncharacterized protein n=1 Tax=Cytophaga hutchinsonii (strain ATCC 33406 / DSM 1761 / CIP 103989 / NBRC 15051 / NCIMB 9469 / D465) TaxID=269798 RepID=A0A6N4SQH3_CYTH3|nr:hypothetical protein [Cytophaga hutchinsonii]ABG58568.1 hypothetical protein CHU_1296 [Cytophaga hutchinsonii ATCC 33406]SFX77240.1 hypothetical protein SAMN04487930_109135 [Cytophaga hutchinsonii ATCC 33406]
MKQIQWDIEIKLFLPNNTLVVYPDENKDEFIENPNFKVIRECLNIDIDITDWYNKCIQIALGKMELQKIEIYYSSDEESYILLDNYRDPYDELDLIGIGVKTTSELGEQVRKLTRILNDESPYNINYCEGCNSVFKLYPIDEKTKGRYKEPQKSEYLDGKEIKIIKSR